MLREYEYTRHGTVCLFGNLHVPTGKLLSSMLRPTRTEDHHLKNLDNVINLDRKAPYRIIADNLTTHCSESCVTLRLAAESKKTWARKESAGF